jgi:hypothetical protein
VIGDGLVGSVRPRRRGGGHNGSVPGYEAVAVYLPEKQMTLVIRINSDIAYQGSEPSTTVATTITQVSTPSTFTRPAKDDGAGVTSLTIVQTEPR